jgi:hypothetical protein
MYIVLVADAHTTSSSATASTRNSASAGISRRPFSPRRKPG